MRNTSISISIELQICKWFFSKSIQNEACTPADVELVTKEPCSGSGSVIIFIRSRILISIRYKLKSMISTVLWPRNKLLSLKTDVNKPTLSNKQKQSWKNLFFLGWRKEEDPDPDPWAGGTNLFQNVMDPEHCYRRVWAKMTLKCELLKVIILRLLRAVRGFFWRFLVPTKHKKEYTVPLF
jgi:hypothetical protein